jgi:hypothetical protein
MADMAGYNLPSASPAEVAEIIGWAIEKAGVQEVQLTAGTLFGSQTECRRYAELLLCHKTAHTASNSIWKAYISETL